MMNTRSILVAFASRYGATQEAAETVADALRQAELRVDLQPAQEVRSLEPYDAIVLGAAIYNTKWHPDAHAFLAQHEAILRQRPVAIFSLGPTTRNPAAKKQSLRQLDRDLEKYPWLRPVALEMFVGKYDLSKMGLGSVGRLVPLPDNRDLNAVRAWANALPAQLEHAEMFQPA
ncbi:MAG TPA: flavodoxin domain-containing protein [Anaerolineae bacterium]